MGREKWAKYAAAAVVYHWVHKTDSRHPKAHRRVNVLLPPSLQRQSFDAETDFLSFSIHPYSLLLSPELPPLLNMLLMN